MAKAKATTVKVAVHKLQLCLLDGIQDESKLFAAGSLMSHSDYQDVVTERAIANMCGYPLCSNFLPSDRPHKGRYHISRKEHKVYDLREAYMYCSTKCVVNSRAFSSGLPEERTSYLNPSKLNEVLQAFEQPGLDAQVDLGRKGDLGLFELKIQEKVEVKGGEVSLEEWIGPSNAIEGYVPQSDKTLKPQLKPPKRGSKSQHSQLNKKKTVLFSEADFTSCIITDDEYSISKLPSTSTTLLNDSATEPSEIRRHGNKDDQIAALEKQVGCLQIHNKIDEPEQSTKRNGRTFKNENNITEASTHPSNNSLNVDGISTGNTSDGGNNDVSNTTLKSSLKPSYAKKETRSVTWADEKTDLSSRRIILSDSGEPKNLQSVSGELESTSTEKDDDSYRFASAEACAAALSEAAEAVVSGCDVSSAVSEAGIIIMPPPQEMDEVDSGEDDGTLDVEPHLQKWPTKPGMPNYDLFESKDSLYDIPPDGFSLSLSPFSTMFMALFAWISSSSLAFIYGRDESDHEEYSSINGQEYPCKIVLSDGRSIEIRQTLAGCLSRALPGVVADLRLRIPISTLEKEMDKLIDTMSFVEPLPPFRMKQWQLIVLLFLDALSVSRIPVLNSFMTEMRFLLPKVQEEAGVSAEEYKIMRDLIIPLGRVPQFTMQSGA